MILKIEMCSYRAFVLAATLLVLVMPATVTGQTFKCVRGTNFCSLAGTVSLLYPIVGGGLFDAEG